MLMTLILVLGIYKIKVSNIQKIMIENGSFLGILLVSVITLVKIKKMTN